MSGQPSALQLRLLQTITAVAAEKNSTLVLPFPVELLRFLERAQPESDQAAPSAAAGTPAPTGGGPARSATAGAARSRTDGDVAPTFRSAARAARSAAEDEEEAGAPFSGALPPDPPRRP